MDPDLPENWEKREDLHGKYATTPGMQGKAVYPEITTRSEDGWTLNIRVVDEGYLLELLNPEDDLDYGHAAASEEEAEGAATAIMHMTNRL